MRKLRRGEVDLDNANLLIDNTLEDALIGSLTENEIRQLSTEQLREIIDGAKNPLRTKSLDIAEPRRIPIKQAPVRSRQKQQTYKMPDLSQDDFNEMFRDWAIKHPEKMRGR